MGGDEFVAAGGVGAKQRAVPVEAAEGTDTAATWPWHWFREGTSLK